MGQKNKFYNFFDTLTLSPGICSISARLISYLTLAEFSNTSSIPVLLEHPAGHNTRQVSLPYEVYPHGKRINNIISYIKTKSTHMVNT